MKYCERYAKILRFYEREKRPNNWSQKGSTIKVEPIHRFSIFDQIQPTDSVFSDELAQESDQT